MAMNPFMPVTQNPYLQNHNQYQSTGLYGQPTMPAQNIQQSNEMVVVPVNGEEGVKNYPVAAGLSVLLMDYNLKKFWVKTTSPNGIGSSIDEYDFTPVNQDQNTFDDSKYATQEDIKELKQSIHELKQILDDLTK